MDTTDTEFAVVISHTHWDRAWYVPFQQFRVALVKLINQVLRLLESDPDFRCFMLDGQTIVLEDYLEVCPDRRDTIVAHVRAGRLQIGPWYVLADEFLVSPESLVRNLLIGRAMARDLGGSLDEGYVPDAFGHIAQLPQILRGFNIDSAFLWRGLGDEAETLGKDFRWVAPDGTEVLAHWMPTGYHNASNLGYPLLWGSTAPFVFDPEQALAAIDGALDRSRRSDRTGVHLLFSGIDHAPPQPELPALLARAADRFPHVRFLQGTLTEYKEAVRAANSDLPSHTGELRLGRYAPILQAVYSSRMELKLANESAQTLLERYAEPLAAIGHLLGGDDERPLLDLAWRTLLKNHPHDDICGCSVDAVHDQMMTRFAEVEQIGGVLAQENLRRLTQAVTPPSEAGTPVVVFNPLGWDRSEILVGTLDLDHDDPSAGPASFTVRDDAGNPVPHQILAAEDTFAMEVINPRRKRAITLALPVTVPGVGYRAYALRPNGDPSTAAVGRPAGANASERGLENAHLRVTVNPDGTLDLEDKETGHVLRGLLLFEDTEDAGDEYTYAPAPRDRTLTTRGGAASVAVLERGPVLASVRIDLDLILPVALDPDRRTRSAETRRVPISSVVSLGMGERMLRIETTVDNTVEDHRLRVHVPTGAITNAVHAGGHYDVVERLVALPSSDGWAEQPAPTAHALRFVDASDGTGGLALLNPGLPEYEAIRDEDGRITLALTLLRCTGWLSRNDLSTRPGHAGPELPAPGAQCPGRYRFAYAILPHGGGWEQVYHVAEAFAVPLRPEVRATPWTPDRLARHYPDHLRYAVGTFAPIPAGTLPASAALLAVEPPETGLVLSALKPGLADGALVARCYSLAPEPVNATLRCFWPLDRAFRANLAEEEMAPLAVANGHAIEIEVRPREVVTVVLYPERGDERRFPTLTTGQSLRQAPLDRSPLAMIWRDGHRPDV